MVKIFLSILILASITFTLNADEFQDAYQKEYTFLKAQKVELQNRLAREKHQQSKAINNAKAKIDTLQNTLLGISTKVQNAGESLGKLEDALSNVQDNSEITGSVVMQSSASLAPYGIKVDVDNKTNSQKLETAFHEAIALYTKLSSLQKTEGEFFLKDGTKTKGEIIKIGNIAAYGISDKDGGALAPAGEGTFRLWKQPGSQATAAALAENKLPQELSILIYENPDKAIEEPKEKTVMDTVKAGGIIGWVIIGLGIFGLLLVLLRIFFLIKSGTNVNKISEIVIQKIDNCDVSSALPALKDYSGATARVIKATLRNIKRDRAHLEDIVTESILNESSSLDRFGNFIMVIAAVAPLLGLLGTVSGMISTFDIITEHGTGDPKLLAGGISEALVTTMLGLIVAIPLLLIGNLLSGWAENIKNSMEQSALHIVNLYEKNREKCTGK